MNTCATLVAVLIASVIGSLHCVGMCGGFVAVVAGARPEATRRRRLEPVLAYQLTRGLAYVILGALAGLLGAGLDHSAALLGVQRLAGPLMGATLIAVAIASLRPKPPTTLVAAPGRRDRGPAVIAELRTRLTVAVRRRGVTAGAAAGLLSALLPCGWLWAYVVLAAGTGSPGWGALVMASFWLGSVPALLGAGLLAGAIGRRLGAHAPTITAAILITLGALSLIGKLGPPGITTQPDTTQTDTTQTDTAAATAPASAPQTQPPSTEATTVPTTAPCH